MVSSHLAFSLYAFSQLHLKQVPSNQRNKLKVSIKSIGHKRHRAGGLGVDRVDTDSPHTDRTPSGQDPGERSGL